MYADLLEKFRRREIQERKFIKDNERTDKLVLTSLKKFGAYADPPPISQSL